MGGEKTCGNCPASSSPPDANAKTPDNAKTVPRSAINDAESLQMESASLRSLSLGSECVHIAYQLVGLRCPGCLFLHAAVRESSHVGWLTRPFDKIHVFVTIIFSFV